MRCGTASSRAATEAASGLPVSRRISSSKTMLWMTAVTLGPTKMRRRLRPFSTIRTARSPTYRRVVALQPTRRPRDVQVQGEEVAGGRGAGGGGRGTIPPGELIHYKIVNSHFGKNLNLAGSGTGATLGYVPIDPTLHGDGGKQAYQSAGSHRDGPTEAQLSASGRRIGRGTNRGGAFHEGACVTLEQVS